MFNDSMNQVLTLVHSAGTIDGRTKFQKIVYILKSKGISFREKFKYHYYGPFSSDLQLEIDELVDRKILKENKGSANSYSYEVNSEIDFEKTSEIVEKKDLIEFLSKKSSQVLELTSTIYFINNEGLTDKDIVTKKLISLKPHLEDQIEAAFELQASIEEENWSLDSTDAMLTQKSGMDRH